MDVVMIEQTSPPSTSSSHHRSSSSTKMMSLFYKLVLVNLVTNSFTFKSIGHGGTELSITFGIDIATVWGFQLLNHRHHNNHYYHTIGVRTSSFSSSSSSSSSSRTSASTIVSSGKRMILQQNMKSKNSKDEKESNDDNYLDNNHNNNANVSKKESSIHIIDEIKNLYPTSSNNKNNFKKSQNISSINSINSSNNENNVATTNSTINSVDSTILDSSSSSNIYTMQSNKEEVVGIGGKGGIIYDVNKLKSNLVQKSIKQFKNELLQLLIESTTSTATSTPSSTTRLTSADISKQLSKKGSLSSSLSKQKDELSLMNLTQKKKEQSKTQSSSAASSASSAQTQLQSKLNEFIDEKISALVSTNPVSTTTDSNLLEGEWDFAYSTNNADYILNDSRIVLSKKKRFSSATTSGSGSGSGSTISSNANDNTADKDGENDDHEKKNMKWKLKPQDSDNFIITSNTRHICLENLEDDEDPYMIDKTSYLDGLAMIERRFKIVGLTRTNLEVQPISRTQYILGKCVSDYDIELDEIDSSISGSSTESMTTDLHFIYLDSDLCITMIGDESGILNVYTKNAEWRESRKKKSRILKESIIRLSKIESPFHIRRRVVSLFRKSAQNNNDFDIEKLSEEEYQILLRRVYADKESKLMALRLGDVGNDDDYAWEGDEDPFVHLSADERQEIMKQMSIEEITEAGSNHKRLMMKLEKKKGFKRQKKFKRPSFGWEGERKRQ